MRGKYLQGTCPTVVSLFLFGGAKFDQQHRKQGRQGTASYIVVVVRPWHIARFGLELLVSMPYGLSFAI